MQRSVCLALVFLLLAPPLAGAGKKPPTVETTRLKDGIHLLRGRGANVGVLSGKDGVLLIDTQYPKSTKPLRAAIRKISKKPIRFLVITHWHGDHVGGIQDLAKSGTAVIAHNNVRKRLASGGYLATADHQAPPATDQALPILTYSDTLTIHFNGQTVRCLHIPLAHTNGDTIVHFVESNVIHMGDIYFNGLYPYIDVNAGGNIDGMIRAVKKGLKIADSGSTIIPGHGPLANREDMKKYLSMLETIRGRVRPQVLAGKSLKEVQASKPTAEFDAQWGKLYLKPDQFTEIVYQGMQKPENRQTLKQGIQVICQAPKKAQGWKQASEPEKTMILASWIEKNLKNTEAINVFKALALAEASRKGQILRKAAREAGVDTCPMADMLSAR